MTTSNNRSPDPSGEPDAIRPSRRAFLTLTAAPVLGALLPGVATAAMGRPEARLGYLRGSDQWELDDPRRRALLRGGLPDPALLTPAQRLVAQHETPDTARLTIRQLRAVDERVRGLNAASVDLIAYPHEVPFRAFEYSDRDALSPMTMPTEITAPVDPERGFKLEVRSRWRGDEAEVVTEVVMGPSGARLQRGAYVLSIQAPAELLALVVWVDA